MADIKDPENTIIIELKDGNVVIELLPDVAPKHVERMKTLARAALMTMSRSTASSRASWHRRAM